MQETLLMPVLKGCPRCGGWARKEEPASRRWHCRGCRWNGFVSR